MIDRELLNPGGDAGDAYESYLLELAKAETFHDALGPNGFHPNTRMFYSEDAGHPAWDHIDWNCSVTDPKDDAALMRIPNGLGTINFIDASGATYRGHPASKHEYYYSIGSANASGDGTVHAGSGKHVPVMSVRTSSGFEHAAAFNSFAARRLVADWLVEMVQEQL